MKNRVDSGGAMQELSKNSDRDFYRDARQICAQKKAANRSVDARP
jgi:hypothetical protein